jgi:hypothetical protein
MSGNMGGLGSVYQPPICAVMGGGIERCGQSEVASVVGRVVALQSCRGGSQLASCAHAEDLGRVSRIRFCATTLMTNPTVMGPIEELRQALGLGLASHTLSLCFFWVLGGLRRARRRGPSVLRGYQVHGDVERRGRVCEPAD